MAPPWSTTTRPGSATELGLDHLIVASEDNFAEQVLTMTDGVGVDVILDHVGGPYLADNIKAAAVRGRIVGIGWLGAAAGTLDMEELARKRLEIIGTTFARERSRRKREWSQNCARGWTWSVPRTGCDRSSIASCRGQARLQAQGALAAGDHVGKIVLQVE